MELRLRPTAYLFEQSQSNSRAKELAKMLLAKFPQSLDDMLLNLSGGLLRLVAVVRNTRRGEIGIVHRVVHTQSYFDGGTTIDDGSCDAGPHGLHNDDQRPWSHRPSDCSHSG